MKLPILFQRIEGGALFVAEIGSNCPVVDAANNAEIEQVVQQVSRSLQLRQLFEGTKLHDGMLQTRCKGRPCLVGDFHAFNKWHKLVGNFAGKLSGRNDQLL